AVDERIGALSTPFGKQLRPVSHVIAGDLACVAKLARAETGDTLSAKDDPLLMEPWQPPEPLLPLAVEAHGRPDEDRLSQGLACLVAEDPALRLEHDHETHQVVLWCLGEAHADVALERLRGRYGVQVDVVPHRVPLRETFGARATGRGRHVKQSGGHGQYAVCEIEVEPLPGGSGVEFVDRVVGGAV
ncbi:elongation factor G-like protein EF-G2, partial [Streptomyces sp. TRM76130]|nr:elongation factor G-like protein EF-G2 [Streptomyces sp. TRM76130]